MISKKCIQTADPKVSNHSQGNNYRESHENLNQLVDKESLASTFDKNTSEQQSLRKNTLSSSYSEIFNKTKNPQVKHSSPHITHSISLSKKHQTTTPLYDQNFTPKSHFKFSNNLFPENISKSSKKLKKQGRKNILRTVPLPSSDYNNSLKSYDTSVYSSVDNYHQLRHRETLEQIQHIKHQLMQQEIQELKDRPTISKYSQEITADKYSKFENVFERLSSKASEKKRVDDINRIEKLERSHSKPKINDVSQRLQRTIDDLYQWKKDVDRKKDEEKQKNNHCEIQIPEILQESKNILLENRPEYLKKKVEDRLIHQGKMTKFKLENVKQNFIESVMPLKSIHKNKNDSEKASTVQLVPNLKDKVKTPLDIMKNFKSDSKIIPTLYKKNIPNNKKRIKLRSKSRSSRASPIRINTSVSKCDSSKLLDIRKNLKDYYACKMFDNKKLISKDYLTTDETSNMAASEIKEGKDQIISGYHTVNHNRGNNINIAQDEIETFGLGKEKNELMLKEERKTDISLVDKKPRYNFKKDLLNERGLFTICSKDPLCHTEKSKRVEDLKLMEDFASSVFKQTITSPNQFIYGRKIVPQKNQNEMNKQGSQNTVVNSNEMCNRLNG